MKSLLVALALIVSVPAFADNAQNADNGIAVDAGWQIEFGPGGIGIGFGPGRGPGFGPGHGGPGWGHPGRPPMVVCQAMNARGFEFYGRGWDPRRASFEAMQQCRYSRNTFNPNTCRVTGCRYQ